MAVETKLRRIRATLRSGEGVTIPAWVLDSGKPGPFLLLTAAQHGNEVQGSEAARRFVEIATEKMVEGKVAAIPFANPRALRSRRPHINMKPEQPYGDDRGHNMNRTWPGRKGGHDTARVSYAIYQAFGDQATHVLDLHCWNKNNAPGVIIREARADLMDLVRKLGHRFVRVSTPTNRTISGRFCATGRVGVTYEFAGQYLVDEAQLQRGMRVVLNMARAIGILPGRLTKGDDPIVFSNRSKSINVTAPCSGLFTGRGLALCDPVKKGDVLGHILSDVSLACRTIVAPATGYLKTYGATRADCDVSLAAQHPYVTRGEQLAEIAWPTT